LTDRAKLEADLAAAAVESGLAVEWVRSLAPVDGLAVFAVASILPGDNVSLSVGSAVHSYSVVLTAADRASGWMRADRLRQVAASRGIAISWDGESLEDELGLHAISGVALR